MSHDSRSTYVREGLLLAAFLILVGAAVVTVALPELSDAPHPDDGETQAGDVPDAGL
jgi:hypothetical protein